jgi:hypothetical protein
MFALDPEASVVGSGRYGFLRSSFGDLESKLGPPAPETHDKLVVYWKLQHHVNPDLNCIIYQFTDSPETELRGWDVVPWDVGSYFTRDPQLAKDLQSFLGIEVLRESHDSKEHKRQIQWLFAGTKFAR